MGITLQIDLTNRWLYFIIVLIIISIIGFGVIAYNSGASPSVMGHSVEELEGVEIEIFQCPYGTDGWNPGGSWASYGCNGQISNYSVCRNIEFPHEQIRNCTPIGKLKVFP